MLRCYNICGNPEELDDMEWALKIESLKIALGFRREKS